MIPTTRFGFSTVSTLVFHGHSRAPLLMTLSAIGIVISKEARIEAPAVIFHGVTLGSSFVGKPGAPSIAPFVTIGAGATVLGDISVGAFSSIGAGVVVTKSVPPMTIVLDSAGTTRPQDPAVIERRFGMTLPEIDHFVVNWRHQVTT